MIVTIEEYLKFTDSEESYEVIKIKISALESFICKYTNNDFINRSTHKKDYPADVKLGALNLAKWDVKFRDKRGIQSETISRYSVTYADAQGENYVAGYPSSLVSFLKPYMKARF